MQFRRWDTSAALPAHQFDLYRSGLCASFAHLTPRCNAPKRSFSASLKTWTKDAQALTQMTSQCHWVSRTTEDLRRAEDDHLYLNMVLKGEMRVQQDDKSARLKSGDMFILDNARPFKACFTNTYENTHVALRIKRDSLPVSLVDNPETLVRQRGSQLLRHALSAVALAPAEIQEDLVSSTMDTLHTILSYLAQVPTDELNIHRAHKTKEAVLRVIAANFDDPQFSFIDAVSALGLPRRTIQHHLALCGTSFSELLRNFRLVVAVDLIKEHGVSASDRLNFAEVAYRTGFSDLSTFYRAFKRKYFKSPGQFRP